LQFGSGGWAGGATGLQAKEKTRHEQRNHREGERSFEGHIHFLVSVDVG